MVVLVGECITAAPIRVVLFLGNRLYKSSRWVCVGVAMVWVVGEVGLFGVLWGCWLVGVCDVYPCLSLCS